MCQLKMATHFWHSPCWEAKFIPLPLNVDWSDSIDQYRMVDIMCDLTQGLPLKRLEASSLGSWSPELPCIKSHWLFCWRNHTERPYRLLVEERTPVEPSLPTNLEESPDTRMKLTWLFHTRAVPKRVPQRCPSYAIFPNPWPTKTWSNKIVVVL